MIKQDLENNTSEIIIFKTADEKVAVDVVVENETVWLTQKQVAELFDVQRPAITKHLKNIFDEGELDEKVVCSILELTTKHGALKGKTQNTKTKIYNLDAILSVGYRVNSKQATQFRIWANKILKEYIIKGFAMDDERLKGNAGGNYWKELLGRIRDIRSSEKVLYRQVLDLYATSVDYDSKSEVSHRFFATVQNKLHYAVNKQTAAEVIYARVDAKKEFMGLTTFAGDLPIKKEIGIAKNYMTKTELQKLNRMVSAFFDLAELKAMEHEAMKMSDWLKELDKFVKMYGKGVLENVGSISHKKALAKAEKEYKKYQVKTLSPVEEAYLENIKKIEKDISQKDKK